MGSEIPIMHKDLGQINIGINGNFSEIPEQIRERSIREGFRFNLLVMGRRGLGCSTLVNSLFSAKIVSKDRTDAINKTYEEIIERDVTLHLSVTTYHGDDFDNILDYISNLNREYYEYEQGLNVPFVDQRIHCCLYLTPSDCMSEKELIGLKELSQKVNLIPLITKADMYTTDELKLHREKLNSILQEHLVEFYDYADNAPENFPMAVIASEDVYIENDFEIRARKYPWGTINIENKKFSDFKKIQRILICERFVDLINRTNEVFYNNSRKDFVRNDTPSIVKQRLLKIILDLEKTIDEKCAKAAKKVPGLGDLTEKINEITFGRDHEISTNE